MEHKKLIGEFKREIDKIIKETLNGEKDGWKYITRFLLWEYHILQKLFNDKEVASRTIGCIIGLIDGVIWCVLCFIKHHLNKARSFICHPEKPSSMS